MPSSELGSTADDDVADGMCTLEDGRKVAYNICGAKNGYPIFYLHGFPGSRTECSFFDVQAAELGAKIIAIDRPGIGLSSPQPKRTVLDHARDIRLVAKNLGIQEYSVFGVSGGGPYALACAYLIPPEELRSVALVCGQGPVEIGLQGMNLGGRVLVRGFTYVPSVFGLGMYGASAMARLFQMNWMSNERILGLFQTFNRWNLISFPEKDRKVMEDHDKMLGIITSARGHFRQGVSGYLEEGRVTTSSLGFDLRDIKRNVQLWYGREDTDVPAAIGEEIARQLGENATFKLRDETHISMIFNQQKPILQDLLDAAS